jgi:hypothetical protein
MHRQRAETGRSNGRRQRRRWFRVRVETEEGAYTGRLRFDGPRGTLRETIGDDRAYLPLWDATDEVSGSRDEYLAIHKSAIRCVVLLGEAREGGPRPEA